MYGGLPLAPGGLTHCPQCGSALLPGRVCPSCQVAWEPVTPTAPASAATPPPLQICPWCGGALQNGACYRCRVEWVPKGKGGPAPPPMASAAPPAAQKPRTTQTRSKTIVKKALRYIPPVRLVWIFLGILIAVGETQSTPAGEGAWAAVLAFAVGLDLVIQFGRFGKKLRFPDAALAIGMFIVILVQPRNATIGSDPTVDYGVTLLAVTAATIVIRHLLRQNGRPWFNPTALGLAVGLFLFGLQVPWAVGVWPASGAAPQKVAEIVLVVIFGVVLVIRQRNTWRFPAFFFATAIPLQFVQTLALQQGLGADPGTTLATTIFAPLTFFYGFFMVSEPRTAPSAPKHMWRFAILVGATYVLLGLLFGYGANHSTSIYFWSNLSSIDPCLALFAGNLYAVVTRKVWKKRPSKDVAPRSVAAPSPERYGAFTAPMFYGGFEIVGAPGPNPPSLAGAR